MYDKGDYERMRIRLGNKNWKYLLEGKTVEEQWNMISSEIREAVDQCIPHKKYNYAVIRHRKPVWMNDRLLTRIRKKKAAFARFQQTRDGKEYLEYTRARKEAKAETRRAVREYERSVAKLAKRNPKAFYSYVNKKLKTVTTVNDLKDAAGNIVEDDMEKAEIMNRFFGSVFTVEDKQHLPEFQQRRTTQHLE